MQSSITGRKFKELYEIKHLGLKMDEIYAVEFIGGATIVPKLQVCNIRFVLAVSPSIKFLRRVRSLGFYVLTLAGQRNTFFKTLKTVMSAENYMSTYAPGMMKLAKDSAWKWQASDNLLLPMTSDLKPVSSKASNDIMFKTV
ncbi:hypothetical protein AB3S75_003522 [Citrus x aurantiifolia]